MTDAVDAAAERVPWLPALLFVPLVLGLLHGCAGYQLGSVKPARYATVESIAIPTFRNDTLEPRSSVLITNVVVQQFQTDGTYRIDSMERADAILQGTIRRIRRRQARSTRTDTLRTREIEFTIDVDYVFRDLRTRELLDSGTVSGQSSQFLEANFQLTERQSLPLAAERLAQDMVTRLAEGW